MRVRRTRDDKAQRDHERYQAFLQQSTEGIWCCELREPLPVNATEDEQIAHFFRHGYLSECNEAMAKMYGFSAASDIRGIPLTSLLVESDPRNTEYLRAFIRSGYRLENAESHEKDVHGNDKYFLNNLIGVRDEKGYIRAWGSQRDITEQKKAEESIQLLNEHLEATVAERTRELLLSRQHDQANLRRLRNMISRLRTAVLATDDQNNILEVNETFCTFFWPGSTPESLLGKHAGIFVGVMRKALVDADILIADVSECMKNREPIYDREAHCTDGRIIVYDYIPIVEAGISHGHLFLARDVTVERRTDLTKSEFMSLASHQLRTPLTSVRWTFGRLIRDLESTLDQESLQMLREGHAAASRMSETIDTMLQISRLESRQISPRRDPIVLESFLAEVVEPFREVCIAKGLRLETDYQAQADLVTDRRLLKEALSNLLSNAVKYTPEHGSLSLKTYVSGGSLILAVADTGYGIPQHQQGSMFRKFFRGDNVIDRETHGTGLGLYLVKLIAEMLGASVEFSSIENRGTTFFLSFPSRRHG